MSRFMFYALATGSVGAASAPFLAGFVNLQDNTPGVPQAGHINVTGTVKGSMHQGNGSLLTNLNAAAINTGVLTLTGASSTYMIRGSNNSGDPNAAGVIGLANSPSGITYGGWFESKSSSGRALFGYASGTAGATYGIYGVASGNGGRAMFGLANSATGNTYGGWFQSNSPDGVGLYGRNIDGGIGIRAESTGKALEVLGSGTISGGLVVGPGQTALGFGEIFRVSSSSTLPSGMSILTPSNGTPYFRLTNDFTAGFNLSSSGTLRLDNNGYWFTVDRRGQTRLSSSLNATGDALSVENPGSGTSLSIAHTRSASNVPAAAISNAGIGSGLLVQMLNQNQGARGIDIDNSGVGPGLFSYSRGGNAVWGITSDEQAAGVVGDNSFGEAVIGRCRAADMGAIVGRNDAVNGYGLHGFTTAADSTAVYGRQGVNGALNGSAIRGDIIPSGGAGIGVYGQATGNSQYAMYANGDHGGSGAKSFVIDHPFDPLNKLLRHFCTEGSQPLNAYSGSTRTGSDGFAWITLPAYVEEINKDFRYQLTVIDDSDDFVLAKVTKEIEGNRFQVRTSRPGVKVSWRVEGVRNDLHMRSRDLRDEYEKPANWKGKYIRPDLYRMPANRGVFYAAPPKTSAASSQPSSAASMRGARVRPH